ncbi:hypothetical protein Ahia01_001063300 [Argonauta hians]
MADASPPPIIRPRPNRWPLPDGYFETTMSEFRQCKTQGCKDLANNLMQLKKRTDIPLPARIEFSLVYALLETAFYCRTEYELREFILSDIPPGIRYCTPGLVELVKHVIHNATDHQSKKDFMILHPKYHKEYIITIFYLKMGILDDIVIRFCERHQATNANNEDLNHFRAVQEITSLARAAEKFVLEEQSSLDQIMHVLQNTINSLWFNRQSLPSSVLSLLDESPDKWSLNSIIQVYRSHNTLFTSQPSLPFTSSETYCPYK